MRMIPRVIIGGHSSAEQKVFRLLEELDAGDEYWGIHSLNVSEHKYKNWSEIDFVLVSSQGVFVLEVKGGAIRCDNGSWYGVDRFGKEFSYNESPHEQAMSAHYALKEYLVKELGVEIRPVYGWGVVFPDVDFEVKSPEMPAEITLDRRSCQSVNDLKSALERLIDYWREKQGQKRRKPLLGNMIQRVVKVLRPNFELVPALAHRIDDITQRQVSLTAEQYERLDAIEEADRIICTGGAGTGKTFLALQAARRSVLDGETVLYVVSTDIFCSWLKGQPSIDGISFHVISDLTKTGVEQHDVLIVDEGQDILTEQNLALLEGVLKSGLENGCWRWFMDMNNQSGIEGEVEPVAQQFLEEFGSVPLRLKRNCRNTPEIVLQTQMSTGADIGVSESKGWGEKPEFCVASGKSDAAGKLQEKLEHWSKDGNRPLEEIAILSPVDYEESCVTCLPDFWEQRIDVLTPSNVCTTTRALFSSIRDFKGLERPCVAIVDLDDVELLQEKLSYLYVAMTRANVCLWIAVSPEVMKQIDSLREENALKLAEGEGL